MTLLICLSWLMLPGDDTSRLDLKITLDTDPATAWADWTSSEGAASFFAKDNKVELKPWGAFEMYFLPEGSPQRGSEGCKVLAYIPGELFSFTWNAPPNFPDLKDQTTIVVLYFRATDDGRTRIDLVHSGFGSSDRWQDMRGYFQQAWTYVLGQQQKKYAGE